MPAAGQQAALFARLPKIDLHLHLEGSVSPRALVELAHRRRLPMPPIRDFEGFLGFLRAFGAVCDLMVDEADFELAARDVIDRARRIGVIHLEILFSPQVFLRRGIPLESILRGLLRARARAGRTGGPGVVYILDGVRQWGGEWFEQVIRQAGPWAGRGLSGAGLGGDERSLPARAFARGYRLARSFGLKTTIHAGEAAGPDSIREALEILDPHRIGHGFRAAEDAELLRRLARRGTPLEICPTSNLATGVVRSAAEHPLPRILRAGVRATINSDDGTFFHTDVSGELLTAHRTMGVGLLELFRAQVTAARVAFVSSTERGRLERRIRAGWRAVAPLADADRPDQRDGLAEARRLNA